MNTAQLNYLVPMTDAVVARGQRAWKRIKATAAEQRELWREVGEALLVGRRLHKSNKLFGQWIKDHGFDDMDRSDRYGAMWLAENWGSIDARCPNNLSHPRRIREFLLNEPEVDWSVKPKAEKTILPADLAEATVTKTEKVVLDKRTAVRLAKLMQREQAGDEGSPMAGRHVAAFMKAHKTTREGLEESVKETAPEAFFRFTPEQLGMLDELKQNVVETVRELELAGLSREAIAAVFINVANELKEN